MIRYLVPIVGFLALVVFFALGLQRDPSFVPSPLIGKTVPEFSLPQLGAADKVVSDALLRGEFSVVNVWATWCVGCREEHSTLNQIAAAGEVPIYGLNWKDDTVSAERWLRELGDPYTATAIDLDGRVAIDWGVYGAPETFLIDPSGKIIYRHISPLTMEVWNSEFLARIAAAEGGAS